MARASFGGRASPDAGQGLPQLQRAASLRSHPPGSSCNNKHLLRPSTLGAKQDTMTVKTHSRTSHQVG